MNARILLRLAALLALVGAPFAGAQGAGMGRAVRVRTQGVPTVSAPLAGSSALGAKTALTAPSLAPSLSALLSLPGTSAPNKTGAAPLLGIEAAAGAETALPAAQEALGAGSEAGDAKAAAKFSSLFDRSVPGSDAGAAVEAASVEEAGVGEAFDAVFSAHPEAEQALSSRFRASAYGAVQAGDSWKADLVRAMRPWLEWRAGKLGFSTVGRYLAFVKSGDENAAAERSGLAQLLVGNTSHRAEEWTYIFRDYPLWKPPLERYLDGLIAERKASKTIRFQSVGAGYGSESYSLAVMTEQALRRAGEDPAAWKVEIQAYDISLMSLLTAGRGVFKLGPRDEAVFKALSLDAYFHPAPGGLLELKEPLRRWIKPAWADLNDPRQQPLVTERPTDIVFANYLLYHLRSEPAHALADFWLSGSWSRHGFLSMAQVAVGEVGESSLKPAGLEGKGFLRYYYGGNIGWAGRAFHGDTFSAHGGISTNWWRMLRHPAAKAVLAAGMGFLSGVAHDPYYRAQADQGTAAYLAELAKRTGLEIIATTQDILAHRDGGRLHLSLGWLLGGQAERALLEKLVAEELARAPIPGPEAGGSLSVRTEEGAVLKLLEKDEGTWIEWLSHKFVPISIDFFSDNAAKRLHEPKEKPPSGPARPAVRLYGLN